MTASQHTVTPSEGVRHTPGPWAAHDVRYNRDYRTCVNVMTEDGLSFVAAVSCDPSSDTAQLHANARLIAAAPDLLEALEGLLNALPSATTHPAIKQARAAINLATGKTGGGA